MSETNTLLNQVWKDVSDTMRQMLESELPSKKKMMQLYNDIYNYMESQERYKLLIASLYRSNPANDRDVNTIIPGGELYFYLKNFLKEYLTTIYANGNNLIDKDFLQFYVKTWDTYQFVCPVINRLFTSFNNNWITWQRQKNIPGIYDIYTMSMKMWQDIFFKETNQLLTRTCLKLIKKERNGEKVETSLIRQVLQSYVLANMTEHERKNKDHQTTTITPSLSTYVEYFEKQFIKETEEYYQLDSTDYLEKNSINDYMKKVRERLDQEEKRVKDYLEPTTLQKLMPKIEEILITRHLDQIQEEATKLLHGENAEDLRIAQGLITRIGNADKPTQNDLENQTKE